MEEKGTAVEKLTSLSQGTKPLTDEAKEIYELVLANKTEEADRSATALIDSGLASPDQLAEYHLLRGAARHRMGKYEQAREDYSSSIELNPDDWRAYYFRWGVNTDLEDKDAAAADEKKMRQLRSEAPDYQVRGGVI